MDVRLSVQTLPVSAYVPCFNGEATLARAVESIRAPRIPIAELFVINNGSTDRSAEVAESLGVRVIHHAVNLGRGAARARAMTEARHDLVLCCDAGIALKPDFLETAVPWFANPAVAAVFGRFDSVRAETVVERWRSRHLLKAETDMPLARTATLITGGAVIRKSAAAAVGGFNPALYHTEDADLGARLLAAGYAVIMDPSLRIVCTKKNTACEVLERYWRWHAGIDEAVTLASYRKLIAYSIKVLAAADLKAGDPLCVPISLLTPHYQFWKSLCRSRWSRTTKTQ